jgi:hypothetical protein
MTWLASSAAPDHQGPDRRRRGPYGPRAWPANTGAAGALNVNNLPRLHLVQAVGDNLFARFGAVEDLDHAVLADASDHGTLLGGRLLTVLVNDEDESGIALYGHRRLRRGQRLALAARDGDAHHHAGLQPAVGIREFGARRDGAGAFVDTGVEKRDAALDLLARIGVDAGRDRLTRAKLAQVTLGHLEIDTHGREVVKGNDRRARVDEGARRHVGQADHARERGADQTVVLAGFGGGHIGLGRAPRGFIALELGARGEALVVERFVTLVRPLRFDQPGLGLAHASVLFGVAQFDEDGALGHRLAIAESHALDELRRGSRQGDRLPALGHAKDVDRVDKVLALHHGDRNLGRAAAPTTTAPAARRAPAAAAAAGALRGARTAGRLRAAVLAERHFQAPGDNHEHQNRQSGGQEEMPSYQNLKLRLKMVAPVTGSAT